MRTLIAAIFASTVALASWQAAEAAETGNFLYGQRLYSVGDFTGALNEWQPLAQQGDARAQTSLAILYLKGRGVPQNKTKAEEWAGRAAAQGYKPGQRLLQQLNKRRAQAHAAPKSKQRTPLRKMPVVAGNFEDGEAAYTAGDHQKAFRLLKPLAEQGDVAAQVMLGEMHDEGEGVPEDDVRAYAWLSISLKRSQFDNHHIKQFKETVVKRMTPTQIAEAQKLSRELWGKYVVPFQKK